MNEDKCDFRRLCLVSVVLISVSAAEELEGFQLILFFSIGDVIFEHIQCHNETTASLLLKTL